MIVLNDFNLSVDLDHCIITWPGHIAAPPSVPSGPLQSAKAGTGFLDTADAPSPQTAGGTRPC